MTTSTAEKSALRAWTATTFDFGPVRVAAIVKSGRTWDREATTIDRSGWQVHRFAGFVLALRLLPPAMMPSNLFQASHN